MVLIPVIVKLGNYSVMFLLHKNAPRGCDQMHEEYVCLGRLHLARKA